jgi:hypothetical protein
MLHACFFDECLPADLHNSAPFEAEVNLQLYSTGIEKDPSFNTQGNEDYF